MVERSGYIDPDTASPEIVAERKRWAAALRSGNYAQCRGTLTKRLASSGEERFCCLGVLGRLNDPKFFNPTATAFLPEDVDEKAGLIPGCARHFATLNDRFGWTFTQIADLIEENSRLSPRLFGNAVQKALWDATEVQTRLTPVMK